MSKAHVNNCRAQIFQEGVAFEHQEFKILKGVLLSGTTFDLLDKSEKFQIKIFKGVSLSVVDLVNSRKSSLRMN